MDDETLSSESPFRVPKILLDADMSSHFADIPMKQMVPRTSSTVSLISPDKKAVIALDTPV